MSQAEMVARAGLALVFAMAAAGKLTARSAPSTFWTTLVSVAGRRQRPTRRPGWSW